jgi:hypothetical protein
MEQSSRAVEGPLDATVVPPAPKRVQLSRAKGWRMPPNTVKVDRTTKWGNPFIVGVHGTAAECVDLFTKLMAGYVCMSTNNFGEQMAYPGTAAELAGRDLACWCRLDKPCHADVLLRLANRKRHNVGINGHCPRED